MATLSTDDSEYRLPTDVSPTHYDLTVLTDLEGLNFGGTVEIDLAIRNATSRIVLNAADLELQNIYISLEDGKALIPISEAADKLSERVTLLLPVALTAGSRARLFIAFTGQLTGSMVGYYRSLTTGPDEDKKYCALTQFEPTAARRAFPCWDEPALKATFAISLVSRTDTVNLSNMPAYSEEPCYPSQEFDHLFQFPEAEDEDDDAGSEWKITRFERSPIMSTYLVAYSNGDFQHLETAFCSPLSGRTVPLRIYTTPKNLPHAGFALELTARVLPLYEKMFEIEYPLPKLDTLVVMSIRFSLKFPLIFGCFEVDDFDVLAMENWGLIAGRASGYLLTNPSMLRLRKEIVALQVHEVAHMWFGNITTMSWWTYLYLNEGWFEVGEVIIPGILYPEWKLDAEFVNEHVNKAFLLDSGLSSHPIEVICSDANKINQIFDGLSYSKSASVLRMLSCFVGQDKFLKGVSLYLKERLYGNSTTADLWRGVEEATGIKVSEIMGEWISKPGFPVVSVQEIKDGVHVRQDRFLLTGAAPEDTIWSIPLQILSVDGTGRALIDHQVVLREREQFIALDTSRPFKINAGTTGYYRVLYSPDRLKAIGVEAAKETSTIFSVADRVGLINDATALAKADLMNISDTLTLIYALRADREYHVWVAIASNLASLVSIWWENLRIVELLNKFRRALFSPIVTMLGYQAPTEESSNDSLLRTCAITQALDAGDEEVANELKGRFTHFLATNDETRISPETATATYTAAVRHGGRQEYDAVKFFCARPKNPAHQISAMQALCAADDLELIHDTFRFVLSEVRDQDIMYFIGGLVQNIKTRRLAAEFFMDNFEEMHERFKDGFGMADLLQLAFSALSSQGDRDHLVTFFKDKDTSKFEFPLSMVLDSIENNSACVKRSSENLLAWLEDWSR
ncbi:leucyl aminopeptidase [Mycena maculata]|uniref:Aminopeptidase n=1 Tax=Mycena maculata TaxID=230809 RepID=A0AAD7IHW8_9AGAR|nr:leucyl aminopeptidase [Mycena maculata]